MNLRLLCCCLLAWNAFLPGVDGTARGADDAAATNVLSNLLETKLLVLSLTGSSAAPGYEFEVRLSRTGHPTTVMRIAADTRSTAILIQTTNGLPFCLMERGLFVRCDPAQPGGLAYYQGGTVLWHLTADPDTGDTEFTCAFAGVDQPPDVRLDLRRILQAALARKTVMAYDETNRTLRLTSTKGSVLEVKLSPPGVADFFGATEIRLHGTNSALEISKIRAGTAALRPLADIAPRDLTQMGLPLRVLGNTELSQLTWLIPDGFPGGPRQQEVAGNLRAWLAQRTAQSRAPSGQHAGIPDLKTTRARAEAGVVSAQANLGTMYLAGDGVRQDYQEAARWLRQAADRGDAQSQYNLGVLYAQGKGLPQSYAEALRLYRKAAEQDYPEAALNLGVSYFKGQGVSRDIAEAMKWFRRAADLGLPLACDYLGSIYDNGKGVPTDPAEAARWYRQAAEKGNALAQFALGLKYSKGNGVERDYAESVRWLRKAAEQGQADAQYTLGGMYTFGRGVATNLVEAVQWYRLAADQGNSSAQYNLGLCLIAGMGVERDPVEACKWLTLAARQNEPRAEAALGRFFKEVNAKDIAEGKRRAAAFTPRPQTFLDTPQ
jgi:TPR repeat protein